MATYFQQITPVHYQEVSNTENLDLKLFLRSKKLQKITQKLITKVHKVQQTM